MTSTRRYLTGSAGAVIVSAWMASADVAGQPRGPQRASLRDGVEMQAAAGRQDEASAQTPRRANGMPDFTGIWVPTQPRGAPIVGGFARFDERTGTLTLPSRTSNPVDFERDFGVAARAVPRERRPWYKPQHWERVRFSDVHGHSVLAPDPEFQCMPPGVPRAGMPEEIVQSDRHMVFVYGHHVRRIYLDGRPHPSEDQWLGTWWGHSVGRWEGDTLVISTVDFNGLEWLGWPGWITSPDKRVTERMRRVGNTLTWEAEVTDSILLQPWKTGPLTRQLNTDLEAEIEETLPCVERDLQHMVTRERG